jgi:two-component system heavy metal sensor histidine kinase CusS
VRVSGRLSLTFRLTLLFAAASTAVLLALGLLIGKSLERHFEEQDMEVLTGKLELARHALGKVRSQADLDALPQLLDDSLVGHHGLAIAVIRPNGLPLFATSGAEFPGYLLERSARGAESRPVVWESGKNNFRGISAPAPTGVAEWPPAMVAVATDISHHQEFMASFRITLWLFVVFAAALTGFLGWVAVRRGLAPLRAMKRGAAEVTASRLDYRLPAGSVPVELAELAETLNEMLSRLEDSFRRLSDFSSDLAHELRTPVSNLMTQTQVALGKVRTADEYREVLYSNAEEFERLARMISDMLFLAKSDNGLIVPGLEPVDLAEEVRQLFEFYEALAEEKSIRLSLAGEGQIGGDKLMLRRAISNLLSNAIRHTHRGGVIDVRIGASGESGTRLSVENTGEAIPAEHLLRLFDRFYRVDPSRQRSSEGAGLGLAIARSIIHAHGGEIMVRSEHGITCFELIFPPHAASKPTPSVSRSAGRRIEGAL